VQPDWVKVTSLSSLYSTMSSYAAAGKQAMLVVGNTGSGVFKGACPDAYVERAAFFPSPSSRRSLPFDPFSPKVH
jgi:hypothetical protein